MNRLSLANKIWGVLGLLVLSFALSVFFSLRNMGAITDNLNEITQKFVKRDQLMSDMQDAQRQMAIASFEMILDQNPEKVQTLLKKFDTLVGEQERIRGEYAKIGSTDGVAIAEKYHGLLASWVTEARKSQKLLLDHHPKEAYDALVAAAGYRKSMVETLATLNDMSDKRLSAKSEESNQTARTAFWFTLVTALSSIVLSLTIAFFVLRSLTRSVQEIVNSLFMNSNEVSSAATQIAASSETLSQCATEQAASLEETAASIEEMSSMVKKTSENADSTSSTSTRSQEKAEQGKKVVEQMIQSMDDINRSNQTIMTQVNESNDRIAEIVKVIEEIGSKTKVINDIVFQTKLLSFNASVEAARAGEHGKGFAVVAEEVGSLAAMSGNAAKEIGDLLDGSIQRVNSIVSETRSKVEKLISDGKQTVESGTRVAKQCGEVLEEIVTNVSSVSHMAGEIASASEEQSRGVSEITKAMGQLDQVTQQNASTSEEAASAAEELSGQAESLKETVGQLVRVIDGARAASVQAKPQAKTKSQAKKTTVSKAPVGESAVPTFSDDRFSEV